ncbi:MAG: hypothetical protein ACUVTQ_01350 [Desulfotomaculales bacterium]
MGWRDLTRWLVLLVALRAVGAGLTVAFSWWGYRALNVTLPTLFAERLEKIGLVLEVASRAREMALAEQRWFASGNEEYRARWQEAGAALDLALVSLQGTVRTTQGQELLRSIADARARWWFGARDDAAREQLLAAAGEFEAFQRRRLGDDVAAAVAQLGLVAGRFALGVTVTGLLALGAVAAGAAVVGRALLVNQLILLTTVNAIVVADRRGRVVAVNVDPAVLNKAGPLTPAEWEQDPAAPDPRGQHPAAGVGPRVGHPGRAPPPRALGREGLSGRPGRRANPPAGADHRGGRRLRCHDHGPTLSPGPDGVGGGARATARGRNAVRPGGGRELP